MLLFKSNSIRDCRRTRPPPSERSVTVSASLRSPVAVPAVARRQVPFSAIQALRIARTAWLLNDDHLCPFAPQDGSPILAFRIVTSTTSMDTPFPWGSHPLGNPMFRHDETSRAQRRCLTPHLHEASLAPILPARVQRHGYFIPDTERRLPPSVLPEDVCWHPR
jgi:hypothetical protein